MTAPRPKPPLGCYWRGNVLWASAKVRGKRYAWTLRTSDPTIAAERRDARLKGLRDPVGAEDAKRRIRAGERLTKAQTAFVLAAIDLALRRRVTSSGKGDDKFDDKRPTRARQDAM